MDNTLTCELCGNGTVDLNSMMCPNCKTSYKLVREDSVEEYRMERVNELNAFLQEVTKLLGLRENTNHTRVLNKLRTVLLKEEPTPAFENHASLLTHCMNALREAAVNLGIAGPQAGIEQITNAIIDRLTWDKETGIKTLLCTTLKLPPSTSTAVVLNEVGKMYKALDQHQVPSVLRESINKRRGEDQYRIAKVGLEWINLLLAKNADYGGSAWKVPKLAPNLTNKEAILVRMSDKIERLENLQKKGTSEVKESFEDTIKDLGAYALLYLTTPEDDEAEDFRYEER